MLILLSPFVPLFPSPTVSTSLFSRWIDKEGVIHKYNGILLSHKKNEFESVLVRWMNLEPVKQSKVSHKKNKHCTLMHIYGIQKNSIDEPIFREGMETKM